MRGRMLGDSMHRKWAVAAAALAMLPGAAFAQDPAAAADSGDTAWILAATALVLLMTLPGLGLFYGGLVRAKNILSVLLQIGAVAAVASLLWIVVGYTLAFGDATNGWLGDGRAWMLMNLGDLREGLTIPAHIPGDAHGSCSFAWASGQAANDDALTFAQSIGSFAFEAARRLHSPIAIERPKLTNRQRECMIWVARGKTDWEISRILGLRPTTVVEHLKNARDRYDAATRVTLTVRALFDGALNFGEIAER